MNGTVHKTSGTCNECPPDADFSCHEYFECANVYQSRFRQDLPGWIGKTARSDIKNAKGDFRFISAPVKNPKHWNADFSAINGTCKALWKSLQDQGFFLASAFKDKNKDMASFEP